MIEQTRGNQATVAKPYLWLGTIILGYIGVYLCRKNLSVAIPMLQQEFGVSKADLGTVASVSTIAYAAGKFIFGPLIDRIGGRACLYASLFLVAIFGFCGSLAGSLATLTLFYSANRLAGSLAWGSMVKLVPDWFGARALPFAMACLSLSFVFGGVCATLFAGQVAAWTSNNWRLVMGIPSVVLILLLLLNWIILPRPDAVNCKLANSTSSGFKLGQIRELLGIRQFWVVCGLSFTLTLLRETFNVWTVDFFKTEGGPAMSMKIAAFLSTPFDAFGAVGILLLGYVFGRVSKVTRRYLLCGILLLLSLLIFSLPRLIHVNLWVVTAAIGGVGFLAYGPYSLLAGIFAIEIRGAAQVATVAGMVDGVGYIASILAGRQFGKIVDIGGYTLGFQCLAALALVSAFICLFLYRDSDQASSPV